jgi:uncharacterized cofD-like protein
MISSWVEDELAVEDLMRHGDFPESGLNLVAIGGGNGLSTLLSGLKYFVGLRHREDFWLETLSAIVTVSDDGGSSGRLRDELQMLPPGDIRNCMVALSEDSNLLSRLFRYRFRGNGNLGGHSFGNLFLAALTEITGDFAEAVRLSAEVLAIKGHIYPATSSDVRLAAELENGQIVRGETNITAAHSVIKNLWLEPETCLPIPEALAAINSADVITVGPGSLFTSLLPPLLVEGVGEAIGHSPATKIFITNLMTQPGETDGYTTRQHLDTIKKYAPKMDFDYIIVNDRRIRDEQMARYAAEGAVQIGISGSLTPEILPENVQLIRTDLLDEGEKVRHHSDKLARVVLECASRKQAAVETEMLV